MRCIAREGLGVALGIMVFVMTAAAADQASEPASPQSAALTSTNAPGPTPEASAALATLLASLKTEAVNASIRPETFDRATQGLTPDMELIGLSQSQPEHALSTGTYVTRLVSDDRIKAGLARRQELGALLIQIEQRFGVPGDIVLAIWGIESNYGQAPGDKSVVRSLATLASLDGARSAYWRSELLAALKILDQGDIGPQAMTGSWAGAMGQTQFMPTTYLRYAVDFDGDGKRDIWSTIADALASTANYLKSAGWRAGEPWGFEVRLPQGFDYQLSSAGLRLPKEAWQQLGVETSDGRPWPGLASDLNLIVPAGAPGPAFLLTPNFRAILRYNPATSYALAVGRLADKLAGAPELVTAWPKGDVGLRRLEREELQTRLSRLGLDTGPVDGILGVATERAVRSYQHAHGLVEDGHANQALLETLRATEAQPQSAEKPPVR